MCESMNEVYVLDKSVRLLQPENGFKSAIDAVLLAAACPVKSGQRLLDLGCGVGTVGFCVLERIKVHVTAVDIEPAFIELGNKNNELNNKSIEFINEDIRNFSPEQCFDHAVCNPPFLESGTYVTSPKEKVAVARGHQDTDLSIHDWINAGAKNLLQGGSLTLIHRADALDRILVSMDQRFGDIEIIPFWPKEGSAAKRIIVRAKKGRKSPLKILPGITLHDAGGDYTNAAQAILREKAAI